MEEILEAFRKLKSGEVDVAIFDNTGTKDNPDDEIFRDKLREEASDRGLVPFQITKEDGYIMMYVIRDSGTEDELKAAKDEIKGRLRRIFDNKFKTTRLISYLSHNYRRSKYFDVEGGNSENAHKVSERENASDAQLKYVDGLIEKKKNSYVEMIKLRTWLRAEQEIDDAFRNIASSGKSPREKTAALKGFIICKHLLDNPGLDTRKKGRRACCESCEKAGFLNFDAPFKKTVIGAFEVGEVEGSN